MPPTNANDPFRTTDHEPGAAPGAELSTDLASGSSPIDGVTATHLPGRDGKPAGGGPGPVPETGIGPRLRDRERARPRRHGRRLQGAASDPETHRGA